MRKLLGLAACLLLLSTLAAAQDRDFSKVEKIGRASCRERV